MKDVRMNRTVTDVWQRVRYRVRRIEQINLAVILSLLDLFIAFHLEHRIRRRRAVTRGRQVLVFRLLVVARVGSDNQGPFSAHKEPSHWDYSVRVYSDPFSPPAEN